MSASSSNTAALVRKLAVVAVVVAAIVLGWKLLPLEAWARSFLASVESMGAWSPLVFGLVYVVASLLGVPRTPFNVGAGVIFPFPLALLVVLASAAVTYVLTFSIARHLAADWVARKIDAVPNARRIMEAVEQEGFKLVLLLRMNPFVPAVIKGYGFGTTSIGMAPYLVASVLGFLPIACAHVYLGWIGGEAMMSRSAMPETWTRIVMIGGAVVSLLLVALVTWFANRALQRRTTEPDAS